MGNRKLQVEEEAKMTSKKTTIKKKEVAKKRPVNKTPTSVQTETEEIKIEEPLPRRYYVQIWKREQPTKPYLDTLAGTIYWSDVKQKICIEGTANKYSSRIENLFGGDLSLPHGVGISYVNNPKDWVRKMPLATLAFGFYATEFMDIVDVVDETE